MSQDDTLNTATLPAQAAAAVDSATLVSGYADTLMTGLFGDIDRLLEGDKAALAAVEAELATSTPETNALALATPPEAEGSLSNPAEEGRLAAASGTELDFFAPEGAEATAAPTTPPKSRLGQWLDRFLLTSTALSLLGVVAFVGFRYQSWFPPLASTPTDTPGTVTDPSTAEFLNYLQRSLDVLTQKLEQGNRAAQGDPAQSPDLALVPVSPPLLPPVGAEAATPGGPRVNVIERVYIPYQTAQPLPIQAGVAMPQAQATAPSRTNVPVPSQPATPAPIHVLVGVLELGDRSAALFEISGTPQRVYIGERIGTSGWNLVSVANQEVVIRRNGEVRSIYIGQRF